MFKFLFGVIIGILIFFFFIYLGGGKSIKKVGEDLTETGKKMEVLEEVIKKEKEGIVKGIEKKFFKKEDVLPKKGQ